jgi:hypothetical protein
MSTSDSAYFGSPDPVGDRDRPTVSISLNQPFDAAGLLALRSAVAAHGNALGLSEHRCEILVLVGMSLPATRSSTPAAEGD